MLDSLGTCQATRTPSKESLYLGFPTRLTWHATEHQGKVKCSALHSQIQREITSALLAQGQPAAPSSPPPKSHCHPPHNHLQLYNPTLVFKTSIFPRVFLKQVSQAQLRPQSPAWEKQGSKRRHRAYKHGTTTGMPGGSLSKQLLPPKNGPTSQRNKRLQKRGRTIYPYSSVK